MEAWVNRMHPVVLVTELGRIEIIGLGRRQGSTDTVLRLIYRIRHEVDAEFQLSSNISRKKRFVASILRQKR